LIAAKGRSEQSTPGLNDYEKSGPRQSGALDVYEKVLWTDPASSKAYENDVVALIGNTLFLFEAKSGGISDSARRGCAVLLFIERSPDTFDGVSFFRMGRRTYSPSPHSSIASAVHEYSAPVVITA